ncbi:Oxidoreductase ordB [Fulvia fulva]|uniref:Oxidoreductase ordB n=1 Tax=Passalora fulva TaxID=5499 RepID=A0A9Q8UWJ4_PASFU|nr:Oxidoreductase ordB [Fulvia fulva]KAK4609015.1 Oxidoreductase ordB [Fulvia fulva]KAK4609605.1 Oxidoreductase ordB [Fulvia fulva]UJO25119.1 Oxidoreductase ordB [Fulvia fulva]WPV22881.1 Oxidoreductase ordB [Fulvia fulva]WPV37388.1 Oxidoreductase ordB [Fulvia fulva]
MASYAVLGATGNTGQALINILLQSPEKKIHAYCRSKQKLLRLTPQLADNKNVKVSEGSLNDTSIIADCIRGTRAVFLAVAVPDNMPGMTIAQDTARVTVGALQSIRAGNEKAVLPKVIVLSSAKLDDNLCQNMPHAMKVLVKLATSNQCADLEESQRILTAERHWISSTFMMPGGLVQDAQKGHALSLETEKTPLSYLDLAAGMVEVADSGDEYHMKNVSVIPTGTGVKFPYESLLEVVKGLLAHYFPWTYRYTGAMPMPVLPQKRV